MQQVRNISRVPALALGMFLFLGLIGEVSASDLASQLNAIDIQINNLEQKIEKNRVQIAEVNLFTDIAQQWFSKLNKVEHGIRKKEDEKAQQHYESGKLRVEKELLVLRRQRDAIYRLNDEFQQGYSGRFLTSLDQLRAEFGAAVKIAGNLQWETARLEKSQVALRDKRRSLSAQSTVRNIKRDTDLKELRKLRKDYQVFTDITGDNGKWCLTNTRLLALTSFPLYFNRSTVIGHITNRYLEEIMASNQRYDAAELSARIKRAKKESDEVKRQIRETILPGYRESIRDLEKKVGTRSALVDPTGCWMLRLTDVTTIRVTGTDKRGYKGVVEINNLEYFKSGETVFIVQRVAGTSGTFKGTEYAYSEKGEQTRLTLDLVIKGRNMDYRSGGFKTVLTRCP